MMRGDAGILQRLLLGGKWVVHRVRAVRVDADFLRRLIPPLVVLVACVVLLEVYVRVAEVKAYMMVPPSEIARTMVKDREDLFKGLKWTTVSALGGFAASAIAGVLMAVILSTSSLLRRAFYPYTIFFQTVPIVAIAPLLLLWFHSGLLPVVACAFVVSVFPVIANTMAGLLSTDPALVDLFQLYGAGRINAMWKLRLPSALPNIFVGLRIAAGLAVIGTIVAEFQVGQIVGKVGLGVMIVDAKAQGRLDLAFAAVLLASMLGLVMLAMVNAAGRLALRNWHASERVNHPAKRTRKPSLFRRMLRMEFPLGKPILVMVVLSAALGAWLAVQPDPPRKDLTLWVFAKPQFDEYDKARPTFEAQSGKSVEIDLISSMAMDTRLAALFMAQRKSNELPDAVEVEINSMGRYLRPPVDQIGFLPLNRYLESSGFRSRILPNRLLSSTKNGQIFGIPHDVHPVALAFREDLFSEAQVRLADKDGNSLVKSWRDFQAKCLGYQEYWRQHGYPMRHAIELPGSGSGMLNIILLQRHINLIDADLNIHINDPKVAETLAFYVQLVAGRGKINTEAADRTTKEYYIDLANGNFGACLMPDWQVNFARNLGPQVSGKLRLIPLPPFDLPGGSGAVSSRASLDDAPTASYGGTLICIPRAAPHPDEAWKLIEFLYLSPQGLAGRDKTGILPPLPEEWDKPQYQSPDPFFGGQRALRLYADLAGKIPPAYVTPLTGLALGTLSYIESKAVGYLERNGPEGLEHQCQIWLDEAAVDLRQRIEHVRFD